MLDIKRQQKKIPNSGNHGSKKRSKYGKNQEASYALGELTDTLETAAKNKHKSKRMKERWIVAAEFIAAGSGLKCLSKSNSFTVSNNRRSKTQAYFSKKKGK